VAKTLDGIGNIRQSSWAMARELAQLEERSTAIGGMVEVIGKVANQTRLLAINASIIASTGGEAGRAFAVVADETRELAVRTSEATLEISKRIEGVQEGARAAKRTMETSLVNVEEGMLLGQDTARALMEILEGSRSAATRAEAIASASQVQARSAQRINQSVAHVANVVDELNHASAQQAQESVRAVASSQTVESLTREVQRLVEAHARASAMDEAFLRDLARTLEQMMGAQHQQKSNAEKVASAVADVERVARRQAQAVHALEEAVRLVVQHAGVLQAEVQQFKV
jgi:methyl-accepting chemotaxis protein